MDLIIQIILILLVSEQLKKKINLNNTKIMIMTITIISVMIVNNSNNSTDANSMVTFIAMIFTLFIFKKNIIESMAVVGLCKSNDSLSYQLRDAIENNGVCQNILPKYLGGNADIINFNAKNTNDLAKKIMKYDKSDDGIACAKWITENIQCPNNKNIDSDTPVSPEAIKYDCDNSNDQLNCVEKAMCKQDKSKTWCESINECISKRELQNNKFYKNAGCSTEIEEEHDKNRKEEEHDKNRKEEEHDKNIKEEEQNQKKNVPEDIVPQEEQEEYAEYQEVEEEGKAYLLLDEDEEEQQHSEDSIKIDHSEEAHVILNKCNVYAYGPDGSEWQRIKPATSKCYLVDNNLYKVRKNGNIKYPTCKSMTNKLYNKCGNNKKCIREEIKGLDNTVCLDEL
jgi:hypothetical protein